MEPLHYIFIVCDGRTSKSRGTDFYETAKLFRSYGVSDAYNLDGGGSATMVFGGKFINRPTVRGKVFEERAISDIIYIGYK